jgi:hypothetical protein
MLRELLQELDVLCERIDYLPSLAPGLPPDDVARQIEAAGLPIRSELVDWFSWHNGLQSPERPFIPPTLLRPSALAQTLQESAAELSSWDSTTTRWDPAWLFLDCDCRVVFDLSTSGEMVALREWDHVDYEFQEDIASPSLTETVSVWVDCLRNAPADGYERYGKSLSEDLQWTGIVSLWGWTPEQTV